MSADFSAAGSSYAGAILNSSAYSVAATPGSALKDFHYSIDLRGSQAATVIVAFLSVDAGFANTGSIAKTFTLTAANTFQTFSGNLGEPGWAPDSSKVGGAALDLQAAHYSWSVLIHAEQPGGWGFDSGKVLNFDNVKLTTTSPGNGADLALTGTAPLPLAGKNFPLPLTVRNNGDADAEEVVLGQLFPPLRS